MDALQADKPVLIVADASGSPYTFFSELGGDATISGRNWWNTETYNNGSLFGNYRPTHTLDQKTGDNFNYVLQNGADGVAFYQVKDASCSVAPYRAYLSCGYNANSGSGSAPGRLRLVFNQTNTATGMDKVQGNKEQGTKFIENGQLYILYNGTKYNVQGQIVR